MILKRTERPAPVQRPMGYLRTLDGWRAIAILAVLVHHDLPRSVPPASWLFENGKYGVDLFFAISGLLICWRLLEDESAFGRISPRGFYTRRAFRILPPALAYLGVIAILSLAGDLDATPRQGLCSLFFVRNYSFFSGGSTPGSYFTAHFWSLAVEEHFYLILPALLLLTRKRGRLPILCGLALSFEGYRICVLQAAGWDHVLFHTGIRLNALLIPAIFAVLVQNGQIRKRTGKLLRFWPLLLIALILLLPRWEGSYPQTALVQILMPLIILGSLLNPHGIFARILEWLPLRYIGRVSYSLYLWQELFLTGHYYRGFPLGVLERTPLRYAALALVAVASYHLLERPFVRLGHRLAPPATPGRIELAIESHHIDGPIPAANERASQGAGTPFFIRTRQAEPPLPSPLAERKPV